MFKVSLFLILTPFVLLGCVSNDAYTSSNEGLDWTIDSGSEGTPTYVSKSNVPKKAIQVGDDLYYVPIEKDERGCMMYRAFSVNNATYAVIMYRDLSGKFTSNSRLANCQ